MDALGKIALGFIVAALWAGTAPGAEVTGAWSKPVKGLRSRVVLDQASHRVGQRMRIRLQLENVSKKAITYALCHTGSGGGQANWQDTLSLSVWELTGKGKPVPIPLRDLYPTRRIRAGPGKDSWHVLQPGQATERDMAHVFYYGADILPRPGRYRIVGVYFSTFGGPNRTAWTGTLKSPPVELSITAPDPLKDRVKVERTLRALLAKEKAKLKKGALSQFLSWSLWPRYGGTTERLVQRLVNQLTNPDADRPPKLREGLAKAAGHALPEVRALAEYCRRRLVLVKRNADWRKAIDARFARELDTHIHSGTALQEGMAKYFRDRDWGARYAQQIAARWKARPALGISLRLESPPGGAYVVGRLFDCKATLTNGGDQEREVVVGGSCGMTHPLRIMVIMPDGRIDADWSRPVAGAGSPHVGHLRCVRRKRTLKPGEAVALQTGFASKAAVGWRIAEPGQYVAIATFGVPHGQKKERYAYAYSAPLLVRAKPKQAP